MRNRPYGFEIYLENVKTICIRTIAHIFVDFSEKLNFNRFDDFFFLKKAHSKKRDSCFDV